MCTESKLGLEKMDLISGLEKMDLNCQRLNCQHNCAGSHGKQGKEKKTSTHASWTMRKSLTV